ncbi:MAG: integrase [Alphaproteobacteria bacterium]|nr:integrase [Alphaproteobacteria bacterium]
MAVIEKRRGKWRAKIRKSGFPSQSKTFTRKADAIRWATETERALQLGSLVCKEGTIKDIHQRYACEVTPTKKSASIEQYRIRKLNRSWLAELQVSELKPHHIATYRDQRLTEVAANACLRDLSLLSHALTVATREWGYTLSPNPVALVRKPKITSARNRRLQTGEHERLLNSCKQSSNHWLLPLVCFAIETAMRRGEMLSLEWKEVYLETNRVHLAETKNGSSRDVPLSRRAHAILTDLPRDLSGSVFPIHYEELKRLWKRAITRAGINDLHFHDLRHEATSRFFEKGLNVMEVATITGHKDVRMLQRYTHLKAEDLAIKLG